MKNDPRASGYILSRVHQAQHLSNKLQRLLSQSINKARMTESPSTPRPQLLELLPSVYSPSQPSVLRFVYTGFIHFVTFHSTLQPTPIQLLSSPFTPSKCSCQSHLVKLSNRLYLIVKGFRADSTPYTACLQPKPFPGFPPATLTAGFSSLLLVSASPSNQYSGWISFRIDWLALLAVQGTLKSLKSLLQHHSSKASILQCSAFFILQLSHPYMTTGKTAALTRWTLLAK